MMPLDERPPSMAGPAELDAVGARRACPPCVMSLRTCEDSIALARGRAGAAEVLSAGDSRGDRPIPPPASGPARPRDPPRRPRSVTLRQDPESQRLREDAARAKNWQRWGPYLPERQWGTVREDYSADGDAWRDFPHDHARSRAYRWGEDGLLGLCDREGRLCFALALWNGRDPILKERLFGLTGPEGNHGEDVKELYYYLDATPTTSYARALYKYPQAEYPYAWLAEESRRRSRAQREPELFDLDLFAEGRYFDVGVEYAKADPDDILIRIAVTNRGPDPAAIDVLPQLWFRNTWAWGRTGEGYFPKPSLARRDAAAILAGHATLGRFVLLADTAGDAGAPELMFTENETNTARLWGQANASPRVKDAFHDRVIGGRADVTSPDGGTKAAARWHVELTPGASVTIRLRLCALSEEPATPFGAAFDDLFATRIAEADAFHDHLLPASASADERLVARQAHAGLLWSRQFYWYVVSEWLQGDPAQPRPPRERLRGRNADWSHLYNRDVLSMPDKWEYPWYAAWDLAFHAVAFARVDPAFAKAQLLLMLREWYMHPNGQIPAYEYALGDVNPPVHAWACWRVYKMTGPRGGRDRAFLERCFQKLLLNFTWWVNRKDASGRHVFGGGFLGLDNIGAFDRSRPLPAGGHLEQADGTAWMAFYALTMLEIAIELAAENPAYEDLASKFLEHFVEIVNAANTIGGTGLWNDEDGFYYDQLALDGERIPLRLRSMVGIVPLFAVMALSERQLETLPGFAKRFRWFLDNRPALARHVSDVRTRNGSAHRLLALPSRDRLERVLARLLDEREFLSPHGIRSLSAAHRDAPLVLSVGQEQWTVKYVPGESESSLFGGNSNWRGPIWMPVNYLLVEALERFHHFYGEDVLVELPARSGRRVNLLRASREISRRLVSLFLPDATGRRPLHGSETAYATDPAFRDLILFYEHFHGDDGRGLGASHLTGWTALVARLVAGGLEPEEETRHD